MELCVVIPLYNESEIIENVLDIWSKELTRLHIDYQIRVYNDGSTDNSLEIVEKYAEQNSHIVVINKRNSGHGATVLMGYCETKNAHWIFQIDSDNEIGVETFEKMWNDRNKADFLIGKRTERNSPLIRRAITLVSRLVVKLFYGSGVFDVNCPYRLLRGVCFTSEFSKIPKHTFAPNVIVSGIAAKNKMRILEYPVTFRFRQTGTVSIKRLKLLRAAILSFYQVIRYSRMS